MDLSSKQIKFRVVKFALGSMQLAFMCFAVGAFFFDELTLIGKIVFSILFIWISWKFWKLNIDQNKRVVDDYLEAKDKLKGIQKNYNDVKLGQIKTSSLFNRKNPSLFKKKNR